MNKLQLKQIIKKCLQETDFSSVANSKLEMRDDGEFEYRKGLDYMAIINYKYEPATVRFFRTESSARKYLSVNHGDTNFDELYEIKRKIQI